MKEFEIKTKKDWCLAGIFAALIVYGISTRFSFTFQSWLLKYGNPMLTNMNQPKSYGNVIFTVIVMVILTEIMLVRHKKSVKVMGFVAAGGIIVTVAVFGLYIYNTDQIVSVIEEEEGGGISIGYWGEEDLQIEEEEQKEIIKLCETLKPVSDAEERKFEKEFYADNEYIGDSILIWATYPKRYGHNFDLMVCMHEDRIFVYKGCDNSQKEIVTFFEDNGLARKVNQYK